MCAHTLPLPPGGTFSPGTFFSRRRELFFCPVYTFELGRAVSAFSVYFAARSARPRAKI